MKIFIFSTFCVSSISFFVYSEQLPNEIDYNIEKEEKELASAIFFSPVVKKRAGIIENSPPPPDLRDPLIPPENEKKTVVNTLAVAEEKEYIPQSEEYPVSFSKIQNKNTFSLFGEFLYFKAVEDNLDYAERLPQNSTFKPKVESVGQHFNYQIGFRLGIDYTFNPWELTTSWMRYYTHPPAKHASAPQHGLLATLATPVWGALGNSLVNEVEGDWELKMDVIDVIIGRFFNFKGVNLSSITGVKMGVIKQKINVHYEDFQVDFPSDVSPGSVIGKSSFWGIGPTLGIQIGYILPKGFKLLFKGNFSCLIGDFNTKTLYQDFQPPGLTPPNSEIKIKNSETRLATMEQIQAGIEKQWVFKKWSFELGFLWEVQIWQKQMRLNYFSTFVSPPSGADLSLYGPLFRARLDF